MIMKMECCRPFADVSQGRKRMSPSSRQVENLVFYILYGVSHAFPRILK